MNLPPFLRRTTQGVTIDLRVQPAPQLGPRGVEVEAVVENFDTEPQRDLPLTLRVDGKPVAKGLLEIEAGRPGRLVE